jgi:hypothetical protein
MMDKPSGFNRPKEITGVITLTIAIFLLLVCLPIIR